ncbi:BA75_04632T0 [Komagataella pastoris]|uniref:BA75_04632T0 n=1 Tax=Komagataella pastoris TaxID=4922 RepID=A0A1B2JHE9_PICPA|nr:BA75_04632T0 [Komagataella pastoris]
MPIIQQNNLTFAETYLLASKVKDKLTKEAVNPKTNLRLLVCQANLLDNLMDTLQNRNEYQPETNAVAFKSESTISVLGNDSVVTTTELSDSDEEYTDDESDYSSSSDDDYTSDVEYTQYQKKLELKNSNDGERDDKSDDEELAYYSSDEFDSDSEDEDEDDDKLFRLQKLRRFYSNSTADNTLDKDNLPQLTHCSSASSSECDEEEEEFAVAVQGKDSSQESYANQDPMMMVHAIEQGRPSSNSVVMLC